MTAPTVHAWWLIARRGTCDTDPRRPPCPDCRRAPGGPDYPTAPTRKEHR